jgi:hypothetical protein
MLPNHVAMFASGIMIRKELFPPLLSQCGAKPLVQVARGFSYVSKKEESPPKELKPEDAIKLLRRTFFDELCMAVIR